MSNNRLKTLRYNGEVVQFVKIGTVWVVTTKSFGNILGYHGKGRRLVASVDHWLNKGILKPVVNQEQWGLVGDSCIADAVLQRTYLDTVSQNGNSAESGTGMSFLTLSGASKVLMRANTPASKTLRNRWEEVTTWLTSESGPDELLIETAEEKQLELPLKAKKAVDSCPKLLDPFFMARQLNSYLLDMEKSGSLFVQDRQEIIGKVSRAMAEHMLKAQGIIQEPKMIPLLTADALSLGGSLPLSKPLPIKFVDWVTASQMADKLGVSEGSIGHYLPIALKGMFGENIEKRANKIADERRISLDQQLYTKHFDTETGLVLVWNDDKSCVAILHQNKSGGFNWRNYWEPKFAEKLMLKLANTIKDAKLPTVPVPTISA